MKHLESEEHLQTIMNDGKSILVFSADWCGDCRFIEPFLPEIVEKFNQYTFVYVNRDKFIDVCVNHDVFGIPSFLAFNQGQEIGRFVSKDRKTQEEIEKFIEELPQ